MVNLDSNLFREHRIRRPASGEKRTGGTSWCWISSKEVRDYIVEQVSRVLDEQRLHVKWDMNITLQRATPSPSAPGRVLPPLYHRPL